jgi:hypothetical protein
LESLQYPGSLIYCKITFVNLPTSLALAMFKKACNSGA